MSDKTEIPNLSLGATRTQTITENEANAGAARIEVNRLVSYAFEPTKLHKYEYGSVDFIPKCMEMTGCDGATALALWTLIGQAVDLHSS